MSESFEYLDVEDLVHLAALLLGDPPPIRDPGLLGAAAARPQTILFGDDAYPDIWTKAAALMQSVVKNNPLVDGNKRLAWLSTAVFLELNGMPVTNIGNDAVYDLVTALAAGSHPIEEISELLRATGAATPYRRIGTISSVGQGGPSMEQRRS